MHPRGHGWHVHALCNQYIPASVILHFAELAGLGRMDFKMISGKSRTNVIEYISRYISRDLRKRCKAARGVRMITASGSLRNVVRWWVRVCDITIENNMGSLRKCMIMICETMGMILHKSVSNQTLFSLAPAEALERFRKLNPGFAF